MNLILICFTLGTNELELLIHLVTSGASGKEPDSIPGWGRSSGEGNGNPLQYLPGEFHGQRNREGYSPYGHRVRHK